MIYSLTIAQQIHNIHLLLAHYINSFPLETPQYTKEDEEMEMDTCEYIESRGYPTESHFATTPDGYVLGLQRIVASKVL